MPPHPSGNPMDPGLDASAMIHAPWRMPYLEGLAEDDRSPPSGTGCFITDYWNTPGDDARNFVIARFPTGIIFLNAFPYANGHLLIAHARACGRLLDYTPAERAELWRLVDAASALCEAALAPQGMNIGVNQGRAGGAGVPQHLHVHIVPRWSGDTNFITTVGRVRVIPSSLETMAARYRSAWARIAPAWA